MFDRRILIAAAFTAALFTAGGAFAAVALGLAITITTQVLVTAPHFGRWQTDLVLALEIAQTILLALAAARALGASRNGDPPSGQVANEVRTEG